jgi:aspartyl-tRNA(Asn)/glutamyl-tRNA(Gln) amidotransferase subunit B
MSSPYRIMVGLEVHVELDTETKMFCRCANNPFGTEPNTNICPVCMGLPGTLPVPNKEAVRKSIIVGKALNSTIAPLSKWDRKHYFYPDLPKGYQISQYDLPLCVGGEISLLNPDGSVHSTIRFERAHLEEDAGKLMHGSKKGYSRVDLNRAGVPLLEMVSKPDLTSAEQARQFLQELQLLMRTLGVSDADMEKGQMRCDVNISIWVEVDGQEINLPITEVKNVNSSRAVERSIKVESQRQYDEWMANGPIRTRKNKVTAGWDEDTNTVKIQRQKEEANDYRYFPEPDIPPISVYEVSELNPENIVLPELPNARRARYLKLGLNPADIEVLISDFDRLARFEEYVESAKLPAKQVANWLINAADSLQLNQDHFKDLIQLVEEGTLSFSGTKAKLSEIIAVAKASNKNLKDIAAHLGLLQVHDDAVVQLAVEEVLREQVGAVADYRAGKVQILGFLVGQVMKKSAGKAQPAKVQEALQNALSK